MRAKIKRILASVLCAAAIFTCLPSAPPAVEAAMPEYENTYINTGNQRKDIIGVALTQLGYTEKGNNDTKYGTWYGLPYQPWCAMFVTWCARQADIPTDILKRSAKADPRSGYFGVSCFYSNKKKPSPGDLFFTTGNTHVGLVYYVEGDYFYTIEGNSNSDHSTEGYCVISNKRKLSGYKFASPKYLGDDKDHTYVLKQESAHPHKNYYECSTCGDKHYTGTTGCIQGCASCFSCGCSAASAGYYLCQISTKDKVASIRAGHTKNVTDKTRLGYIGDRMVVYVHGMANGYACIEYDNLRGHVLSKYLKPYYPAPGSPAVTLEKQIYRFEDSVSISWNKPVNTEEFRIRIYRDDTLVIEKKTTETQYTLDNAQIGEYTVQIFAGNRTGSSKPGTAEFSVRDIYQISYHGNGGSGCPDPQEQTIGLPLTIPTQTPAQEGFDFLGWTSEPNGNFVEFEPGDSLAAEEDLSLYAVWKNKEATTSQLTIAQGALRRYFLVDEVLDTEGLVLKVLYSDGSGHLVRSGFTTSGFSSESLGDRTVTVSYGGLTVTYDIHIVPYIPGDINQDKKVNRDDVMLLLWHINFSTEYPITVPADYTADDKVNRDDVINLLWHVNFPSQFPLDLPSGS